MQEEFEIFDISPLIHEGIAVFPGDTPFRSDFLMRTSEGHNITLSKFSSTVHLGAHVDAPNHYAVDQTGISERSLHYYMGKCQVIEVNVGRGERIRPHHCGAIENGIVAPRVLFRTKSFPNPDQWNNDFASLSSELIHFLAARKVITVGIDTPSIDLADDKILESHTAVHHHDMAILEGIVLDHVPAGVYELIALPLKIKDADASPVRAILRRRKN